MKNQIILNENIEAGFELTRGEDQSKRWRPDYSDLKKVSQVILGFLNNAENNEKLTRFDKGEIKKILTQINEYRVQYVGITKEGKKRIWCNFFPVPAQDEEDDFNDWRTDVVFVFDGGYDFWCIEYDVDSGKCLNFSSNGYA